MSYHHIKGTIKHRVANRMRLHLKYYYRSNGRTFSNKPDKIFAQYCKLFKIPFENNKNFITNKCVEWFFDENSKFYHSGSEGKGLEKIIKHRDDILNNNKQAKQSKPQRTYKDMPDKVDGKYNYAKYKAYLKSSDWKRFRLLAIEHHGKICNKCKRDELPVDVHHLTYDRLYNELLIDVEILCRYCHKLEHKDRVRK